MAATGQTFYSRAGVRWQLLGFAVVLGFDCVIPVLDRFVNMLCVVGYGSNKPYQANGTRGYSHKTTL